MEAQELNQNLKTYTLTFDEPHLSSRRLGLEVSFRAGDQIIVVPTKTPRPGSLVIVRVPSGVRLCRFEKIYGNDYLFPPVGVDPSCYGEIILGQVVDHVRISKWLTL